MRPGAIVCIVAATVVGAASGAYGCGAQESSSGPGTTSGSTTSSGTTTSSSGTTTTSSGTTASSSGSQDSGDTGAPCAEGCIEPDGGCHAFGGIGVSYDGVDDTHCGTGVNRQCLNCSAAGLGCLYYPGVDGPACVCPGTDYPGPCQTQGASSGSPGYNCVVVAGGRCGSSGACSLAPSSAQDCSSSGPCCLLANEGGADDAGDSGANNPDSGDGG
jgi:hypothetical protein